MSCWALVGLPVNYASLLSTRCQCHQQDAACTATSLRWLNVALLVACFYVMHAILQDNARLLMHQRGDHQQGRQQHRRQTQAEDADSVLYALVLCAFPLLWSYTFMYYTDVGSSLLLLLCHLLCLIERFGAAAIAGAASVLFRQTNAVWVTFFLGASMLRKLQQLGSSSSSGGYREARRRGAASEATASLPSELGRTLTALITHWRAILCEIWPMLVIPFGFVAFLVANGGAVVVGDRAAHAPVCHAAQLLYFGAFACASLAPVLLPGRRALVNAAAVTSKPRLLLQTIALVAVSVLCAFLGWRYSLAHPYLLADNRHYTFYIWRRLLGRPRVGHTSHTRVGYTPHRRARMLKNLYVHIPLADNEYKHVV